MTHRKNNIHYTWLFYKIVLTFPETLHSYDGRDYMTDPAQTSSSAIRTCSLTPLIVSLDCFIPLTSAWRTTVYPSGCHYIVLIYVITYDVRTGFLLPLRLGWSMVPWLIIRRAARNIKPN